MSVLLLWEHPELLIGKAITKVTVYRDIPEGRTLTSGVDVPWGFFEDVENDDPTVPYKVEYMGHDGTNQVLEGLSIQRMKKTDQICLVTLEFVDATGFPVCGKRLSLSMPSDVAFRRQLYSNEEGKIVFPARRGTRMELSIEGRFAKLDTVIPDAPTATWEDLMARGSLYDADQRGWY